MKQKKTIVSVLGLCLVSALLLGGCHSDPVGSPPPSGVSPSPAPSEAVESPEAAQGLQIALCCSPNSVDDYGRNADSYNGVLSFLLSRGAIDSLVPLQETTGDPFAAPQAFQPLAASYDVMVFVGPAFTHLGTLAQENPDKYFILVDAPLTAEDGSSIRLDNVSSLDFAEQECGFLAGMTAALESQTGRVAVINDQPGSTGSRYYYGFRSGVAYSNGNLGTNAEVIDHPAYGGVGADGASLGGNYTLGSDAAAYALGGSLLDEGCDILFVAAGTSGIGAINAVKERPGAQIIGAETDQFPNGIIGSENVVLTSITKGYANAVLQQLSSIADGTFQGGSHTLRAADGDIGYVSDEEHQKLKPETLTALATAYPMIQDGTIVPMSAPQ